MGNLITPKKCINIKLNLVYYCLLLCAIEVNIDVTKTVFIYLFVFLFWLQLTAVRGIVLM